jgi:exosome complex component RRP41
MSENEFIRPDGRKTDELRNIKIEVGVLERADGSARVELGKNIVLASVNGPREMHPKHASLSQKAVVRIAYRMMPFSVEYRKNPFPSRREKEISKVLSEAFESVVLTKLYPRSVVDVFVQMIQSDGGSRTAAAIATSAALADAGIPMRGLIAGIASGLYEDHVCLDLSGIEDNVGTGDMPLLYSPQLDEVSLFQLDGLFTPEQFKTAFNKSIEAIKIIEEKQREALKQKYIAIRDQIQESDDEEDEETDSEITSETDSYYESTDSSDSQSEAANFESADSGDSSLDQETSSESTNEEHSTTSESVEPHELIDYEVRKTAEGTDSESDSDSEVSDEEEEKKKRSSLTERDLELQDLELGDD